MNRYIKYLLMLCWLLPVKLSAQQTDITGMWYGELQMNDTAGNPVHLPYEVAISEEKGKLTGYSRIVFHANGKDEAGVQDISVKRKGDEVIMEDEGFIDHDFTINPTKRVKKTVVVKLTSTEKELILEGTWSTNRTRTYIAYKGTIVLKRKNDFKKSELFKSLDTLKLVAKLSFKDRPETAPEPVKTVAVDQPVVSMPEADPDLIIPALGIAKIEIARTVSKPKPSPVKIQAPGTLKKAQMDALAKSTMKPVVKPAPVVPKPEPVVVAAAPPKPERKPAVSAPPPTQQPAPEKKPEPAPVVKVTPKPVPPPPQEKIAPSVAKGAAEIDKRVTKSDQSFYFESDSLLLTLYDNGEVDGDTVTVLMNGNVIFSKVGLTTKANSKTVYITPDMDSVKLVMYAESLGEIPPNTGLLIVNDADKRYEIRFSADLTTNAAIVFKRKKNE